MAMRGRSRPPFARSGPGGRPHRRLRLEYLEARTLLAVITVNTALDENSQTDTSLSLREAIEVADGTLAISALSTPEKSQISGSLNTGTTPNTIAFAIPGRGRRRST